MLLQSVSYPEVHIIKQQSRNKGAGNSIATTSSQRIRFGLLGTDIPV